MREKLILENQNLIYKVLNDLVVCNKLKEDLFQEGIIALIKAVDTYKNNMNIKFSTYAYKCIYNYLVDKLKKKNIDTISLYTNIKDDIYLLDIIQDKNNTILNYICKKETHEELIDYIYNNLSKEDRYLICSLYGINKKKLKQNVIANHLNITQSCVAKKHKKIIDEMRKNLDYRKNL